MKIVFLISDNIKIMWEYILTDDRILQIYCNESSWSSEILVKERQSLKSKFLGDFMIAEHERMSAIDLEYFTKMVRIFSESANVMLTKHGVSEIKKSFRIFSPEAQDEYNRYGNVPRKVELENLYEARTNTNVSHEAEKAVECESEAIQKFSCLSCSKEFRHDKNLKVHVRDTHSNASVQQFKCPECPKTFKKRTKLSLHFSTHKEIKLSCILCHFKSNTSETMGDHMKSLHENDRHLKCEPCDIWYESEDKLNRHISYHTRMRNKTEQCKRCYKKLLPGLTMKRHMMTEHKKKLACALCGKENFSGIVQLNSHIVKEHVSK